MFKILNKQILSKDIHRFDIQAPHIAEKYIPGQFLSLATSEGSARLSLPIVDTDTRKGSVMVIVHETDRLSRAFAALTLRDTIYSVLGPLGIPTPIEKKGVVVCIATGIGAAQVLPIARALKKQGNKVIGIVGAKTKRSILLESQMRLTCNKIFLATNDGTYERKGLATDILKDILEKEDVAHVYAVGSVDMMRQVSGMTHDRVIPTTVYLNPMMVDCMGMCGSCRVKIGDETVLACIHGPAFHGHFVDYDYYQTRLNAFEEDIWRNQQLTHNPVKNESGTFKKFLSGILSD